VKYFLDCEFYEDGKTIDMVSIGVVAQDGREFYAVNADFNWDRVLAPVSDTQWKETAWLRDNVMGQIDRATAIPASCIRERLHGFLQTIDTESDGTQRLCSPQLWGYYSATDFVCFYQLWGRLIDLPRHLPKWCRDIKQLHDELGRPELPYDPKAHHALEDARWQKLAYEYLLQYAKQKRAEEKHEKLRALYDPDWKPRPPEYLEFGGQRFP
jgi:hypothetical protein